MPSIDLTATLLSPYLLCTFLRLWFCFVITPMKMSVINIDGYHYWLVMFSSDLIGTIINTVSMMVDIVLFLSIFYVYMYRKSSEEKFQLSFHDDYFGYLFLTTICAGREIYGKSPHLSMSRDSLKNISEEPYMKFLFQCDIDVYYDKYDDLKRDKDQYQTIHKNIHFHLIEICESLPKKAKIDNINTALNIDQNHSDIFISCSLCFEQVERSKIPEHYLSETHQQILPNILLQLHSRKINNPQQEKILFTQINDTISILSNDARMIDTNIQQIVNQYRSHENSLQIVTRNLVSIEMLTRKNDNNLYEMGTVRQDIDSLKEHFEHRQIISFDGTFLWKISDIQQKIDDAKFERKRSIYSPEFYSSSVGYKMCSRLFLDGVNNARGTHWSIYFILMRGDYDALLEWPFSFKVTFSLLDQTTYKNNQSHWSKLFWSDIKSVCFRRPRLQMNEAYGIENFLSLDQLQNNQNRYVQNDTVFIKVDVDFQSTPPGLFSDSAGMLINDERHTDTNDDDLMRRFLFMMENSNRAQ